MTEYKRCVHALISELQKTLSYIELGELEKAKTAIRKAAALTQSLNLLMKMLLDDLHES